MNRQKKLTGNPQLDPIIEDIYAGLSDRRASGGGIQGVTGASIHGATGIQGYTGIQGITGSFSGDYLKIDQTLPQTVNNGAPYLSRGLKTGKIYPSVDGTTGLQLCKADGTTIVANIDTINSKLELQSGSLSSLPYSFILDKDTGIYNPYSDSFGFVGGGVEILRIDSGNAIFRLKNNVRFAWDTGVIGTPIDVAIYKVATNTLGIGKNSTNNSGILTAGKIGIGTVSPAVELDVVGSIHGNGYISSDGYTGITSIPSNSLIVKNGLVVGATGMKYLSGTGTLNYIPKWAEEDGTRVCDSLIYEVYGSVAIGTTGTGPYTIQRGQSLSSKLSLISEDSITNATKYPLTISSLTTGSATNGLGVGINFRSEDQYSTESVLATVEAVGVDNGSHSPKGNLVINTYAEYAGWQTIIGETGLHKSLEIDYAGRVGIGTGYTGPQSKLHVNGDSLFEGTINIDGEVTRTGLKNWSIIESSNSSNTWNSICYGNGIFVAVSIGGTNRVMWSDDAKNWHAVSADTKAWYGVTFGNGRFVAVGSSGAVMYSSDAITWTLTTAASTNHWSSICYGNGLFVAVSTSGTGNRVMTSPDGITWASRTSAADNNWKSVCYGDGLFVAVAYSGTGNRVMTSPDGITWTSRTSAADNNWNGITYGNGLFVAVALTGTGNRVMTSPDGITWTSRTSAAENEYNSVCYGGGLFVAVAQSGTYRVMASTDGITWKAGTAAAAYYWRSICYADDVFIAIASYSAGNSSGKTMINGIKKAIEPIHTPKARYSECQVDMYYGTTLGATGMAKMHYSSDNRVDVLIPTMSANLAGGQDVTIKFVNTTSLPQPLFGQTTYVGNIMVNNVSNIGKYVVVSTPGYIYVYDGTSANLGAGNGGTILTSISYPF